MNERDKKAKSLALVRELEDLNVTRQAVAVLGHIAHKERSWLE